MNGAFSSATTLPDITDCPDEGSIGLQIALLAHRLDQRVRAHLDQRVAEFGLTAPQAQVIRLLEEPMPMYQVAEKLQCDPSNVTGIVDRLEVSGFVERRVLPADRRVKQLILTPAGRQVQECLMTVFDDVPGLSDLSETDLQTLHDLLERVVTTRVPALG